LCHKLPPDQIEWHLHLRFCCHVLIQNNIPLHFAFVIE
jgi:hypothetical protein